MTTHSLIITDTRKEISTTNIKPHLIITSPPYYNIKDYKSKNQIGFGQTYTDYISDLEQIFNGCHNILYDGCKMIVNIGDQFLRAKDNNGKYEILPIHADIINVCKRIGFTFLGNIIWTKITNTQTSGGCSWMGSIYYPRDGYITYEHEYILIFKKDGKAPIVSKENKEASKLTKEERSKWFRGVWDDICPIKQKDHQAMFPLEIPYRLIKMFSFVGETILDPFVGSGQTMLAAKKLCRESIGFDCCKSSIDLIKKKIINIDELIIR